MSTQNFQEILRIWLDSVEWRVSFSERETRFVNSFYICHAMSVRLAYALMASVNTSDFGRR